MLLAENKYKNLKQAGKWGNLSEAEAEIIALNSKIDVLKQKGTKKPEGKSKKEENKQHDEKARRKRRKLIKRKQTFIGKTPGPTKRKGQLKGKNITGVPITRIS